MNSMSMGSGWELTPEEIKELEESLRQPPPRDVNQVDSMRDAAASLLAAVDAAAPEERESLYNFFVSGYPSLPEANPYPSPGSIVLFESSRLLTPPEIAQEVRIAAAAERQLFAKGSHKAFAHPEVNKQLVLMSDLDKYFVPAAAGSPALLEAWFESRIDGHTRALGIRSYSQGKLEILLPQGCLLH